MRRACRREQSVFAVVQVASFHRLTRTKAPPPHKKPSAHPQLLLGSTRLSQEHQHQCFRVFSRGRAVVEFHSTARGGKRLLSRAGRVGAPPFKRRRRKSLQCFAGRRTDLLTGWPAPTLCGDGGDAATTGHLNLPFHTRNSQDIPAPRSLLTLTEPCHPATRPTPHPPPAFLLLEEIIGSPQTQRPEV
jgi:hypothetical protein